MTVVDPNMAQRQHWVDLGRSWADSAAAMEQRLVGWGESAMDHLGVSPGERVVDIGCGTGGTTLALAGRVGPAGAVVGVDISPTMLAEARRAGTASGLANVSFAEADAQVHPFESGRFDVAFSRFGIMFFADPVAAFANIGGGLRAGGRFGFACWGRAADNRSQARVRQALSRVVDLPPVDPNGPGPNSFAAEPVLRATLETAGYRDLRLELVHRDAPIGGTAGSAEEMVEEMLTTGPTYDQLSDNPDLKPRLIAALLDEFGAEWQPGGMWLPAAVWLVAAHWPGSQPAS